MSETEEDPFISQPAEEITNQAPSKPPQQVSFRLLCDVNLAGGVIGKSGSIVKKIETLTGTQISFESPLRYCQERVINIVGSSHVDREFSIVGRNGDEMWWLSEAQEGLIRVFQRILEVRWTQMEQNDHTSGGVEIVRLLAPECKIGSLIGKGGLIAKAICTASRARLSVLTNDHAPASAAAHEEVIQITGTVLAVKKALIDVSCRLQDCATKERGSVPGSISFPRSAAENDSVCHSLYPDFEKMVNLDEYGSKRKVVFRLLCASSTAGGVIGKGASIVKSIEKDTGACICFTPAVSGLKERVAIISSSENADPLHSPAQIAVLRVFARCMEIELHHGKSVIARILVTPSEVNCLMDLSGRVASDISRASGVAIQLMGGDLSSEVDADDIALQITGEYENVKSALFQVTSRLRTNFFPRMGLNGAYQSYDPYTAIPSSLRPTDSAQGWKTYQHQHNNHSKSVYEAPKQTVEVVIPGEAFDSIYGDNGSNLALLKEISGASIEFQDPSSAESHGKVIISGTPERIKIAQSVLQTFIIFPS